MWFCSSVVECRDGIPEAMKQIADDILKCIKKKNQVPYIVTSNFSFFHHVLHSYISLVRQNVALCGNGLKHVVFVVCLSFRQDTLEKVDVWLRINPSLNYPQFLREKKAVENIMEKGKK